MTALMERLMDPASVKARLWGPAPVKIMPGRRQ
jgi:hypothetical protein